MELIKVGGKTCVIGCRWKTSSTQSGLEKDAWRNEWNAAYYVTVEHEKKRFSIGVAENSASEEHSAIFKQRKIYSLAAMLSREIKNGVALFKIEPEGADAYYWAALYSDGVVEMDFSAPNIQDICKVIVKRLSDVVANLIPVENPIFVSNMDVEEETDFYFKELRELRHFADVFKAYGELDLLAEQTKIGSFRKFGGGFSEAFSREVDSRKKKDLLMYFASAFILIAGISYYVYFELLSEEEYIPPVEVKPVYAPPPRDYKKEISDLATANLMDNLLGKKVNLFEAFVHRFDELPLISFGFRKTDITCTIALGRCEVSYLVDGNYREFEKAFAELSGKFDEAFFTIKGDGITGVWKILPSLVYKEPHSIQDLPLNDRGRSIVNSIVYMNTIRKGVAISIENGDVVTIKLKQDDNKVPSNIERKYISLGWKMSAYKYQVETALNEIKRPFMTLNYFNLTRSKDGIEKVSLSGAYLYREVFENEK